MKELRYLFAFVVMALLHCNVSSAESLNVYVDQCKVKLGFTTIPNMNCNDGKLFAPSSNLNFDPTNDYVGALNINDNVDVVFACRWYLGSRADSVLAASVELLIHNHQTGDTCFFSAKEIPQPGDIDGRFTVSPAIVSPTGPHASSYWKAPTEIDGSQVQCVGCHVAGAYIASQRIAPYLASFGLLNNGHDTMATRYHAVGTTFNHWNTIVSSTVAASQYSCAGGCHVVGDASTAATVPKVNDILLPSISDVVSQVQTRTIGNTTFEGVMPANKDFDDFNAYRWINMDSPNGTGEYETLIGLKQQYPQFYCSNPVNVQAHVVGADAPFDAASMWTIPDYLWTFNARDGMSCYNEDQPGGRQCHDYWTHYLCGDTWTEWTSTYAPDWYGDFEPKASNICSNPKAIEIAAWVDDGSGGHWGYATGPADRLAAFDPQNGLVCNNADQGAGQSCSNYVVQFNCDQITPPPARVSVSTPQTVIKMSDKETTFVVTTNTDITDWVVFNDYNYGRSIYVNGVAVSPRQMPLPPRAPDGKYYFTFSAVSGPRFTNTRWFYYN
jgi:hypothetical protein